MKHGEEGTHSVCNKHFALLGGKSTCCVCGEKKDCSNTPSPKPCCAFSGKKCCDKCRYPYQEKGVDCEHTAACNFCPCHQAKPEGKVSLVEEEFKSVGKVWENKITSAILPPVASPGKKDKCEDSQCFDANCSTHGIHPTPPEKEEKCICEGELKHEDVKHSKDNCYWMRSTLPEQKGEWEEEFDKKFPALWHELGHDDLILKTDEVKSFIAAKKKEWEAQKEQAVKAEIRERIEKMYKGEPTESFQDLRYHCGYDNALEDIIRLLSDKVTH